MRSNFKYAITGLPIALLLLAVGCQTKFTPVGSYSAPVTTPNYTLICNFDGNLNTPPDPKDQTNRFLFEVGGPNNRVNLPGNWMEVNNFPGYETGSGKVDIPGANGTPNAYHVIGAIDDVGNGQYPAVELNGYLDSASPYPKSAYNISFFTGVKFWINITNKDTATFREFFVTTVQEAAPPLGTCKALSGCYNYFGYQFPGPTNGWKPYSFDFTSLITSFGVTPIPPTFTGENLQEVLGLLWEESRQNTAGHSDVDFWVDEVYFY